MAFLEISFETSKSVVRELRARIAHIYNRRSGEIDSQLIDLFNELKPGLFYCVEYPYVDWVYRDTFYAYFSSKHNEYARNCIRVSVFGKSIRPEHFRNRRFEEELQAAFKGYIVIRPTFPSIIGRTVIHPSAFKSSDFKICQSTSDVMINGVKLTVSGFPFSSQDTEAISCAETTVWAIMEYFGNRYAEYQPVKPSRIIEVLQRHSVKRLLPSSGLTVDQISMALKEYGFGTQIYARDDAYGDEINNIIGIYVESGIPLIAAVENDNVTHAILIIGHENDDPAHFKSVQKNTLEFSGRPVNYIDYSELRRRFIINDDNLFPYRSVMLDNPTEHYTDADWSDCKITAIVVPLQKKIYLDALGARALALEVLADPQFGHPFGQDFVFRFFLTSSRSFKHHVAGVAGFRGSLKDLIVNSSMPKFVWCAEIYTRQNADKELANGLIVLDATEADDVWLDSVIFAGYPDRCYAKFGLDFIYLKDKFFGYKKFINNLQ